ncbi:MAG: hypothetical protein IJV04_08225 [Lachnospiraceae bacterium]|nr:hypothetical protein [Lachnospiraceae bacterium]MBQ9694951.1 hypothetical protein [Oscillospiraceae bacterium]MBR1898822.1 hypothetical protein [Oscillospiraceae bacterium]
MEELRMENALRRLGSCQVRAPARLLRNMTLTVRSLEAEKARRLSDAQAEKRPEKHRKTTRDQQLGDPEKKKTL